MSDDALQHCGKHGKPEFSRFTGVRYREKTRSLKLLWVKTVIAAKDGSVTVLLASPHGFPVIP